MSKILRKGCTGPEVKSVQTELNTRLTTKLAVDGVYGPKTDAAVRRFQAAVGFKGRDVDGVVGPKTTVALFQIFNMNITGQMKLRLNPDLLTPPAGTPVTPPTPVTPGTKPPEPAELPKKYQFNAQGGYQYSDRDGPGSQVQLNFVFRSRDYFPNSGSNTIYHGMHSETSISPLTLGIPNSPGSGIYTGQFGFAVSPVTDWLVLWDRLHLLTPSVGAYGQIPFNPSSDPSDPANHSRLGGFVGLELFHADIIKDRLAIGISGQESGYWDFQDRRVHWDPSVLGFLQWTIGSWSQYKPKP